MMADHTDRPSARQRLLNYLTERQSPAGGFCFYRSTYRDDPNLADTYYAISIYQLLGEILPKQDVLLRFLDAFQFDGQIAHLYCFAMAQSRLNAAFTLPPPLQAQLQKLITAKAPQHTDQISNWLQRQRLAVRLGRHFNCLSDLAGVVDSVNSLRWNGGFGHPNLTDTWLALDILACCDALHALDEVRQFVHAAQCPYQGFINMGEDSSSLEVLFAGVRCAHHLRLAVQYRNTLINAILRCQRRTGGFARMADALPDIRLSYQAVWSLKALAYAI